MKASLIVAAVAGMMAVAVPAPAQLLDGEKAAEIEPIAGVIADGARWEIAWAGPMTADGMATSPEGHVLFAQEQSNSVRRLWPDGSEWVAVPYVHGAGAVSVEPSGRVLAVERTCTDPGLGLADCAVPTRVVQLAPERRVIASSFADGSSLGRLNDLEADGHGGAWFTQGALYHAAADGSVTKVADAENFTNGLALSPDGATLYVTDRTKILAFDISENGTVHNQRVFATLSQDTQGFGGDGMTADRAGRLYVTGDAGVYVFDQHGAELGIIPVPRRAITLTFAGPDRRTLYVGAMGAVTPEGKAWTTPEGVRNVAMTIYRVETEAAGL